MNQIDTSTEAVERMLDRYRIGAWQPAPDHRPVHERARSRGAFGSGARVMIRLVLLLLLASPAFASRPPADLDLSQPAPKPRPEGLCEMHPLCKGTKK